MLGSGKWDFRFYVRNIVHNYSEIHIDFLVLNAQTGRILFLRGTHLEQRGDVTTRNPRMNPRKGMNDTSCERAKNYLSSDTKFFLLIPIVTEKMASPTLTITAYWNFSSKQSKHLRYVIGSNVC